MIWGGAEPPYPHLSPHFICLRNRVDALKANDEQPNYAELWHQALVDATNECIARGEHVVVIMQMKNQKSRELFASKIQSRRLVVWRSRTKRTEAACWGWFGDIKQGVMPSVDDVLQGFNDFQCVNLTRLERAFIGDNNDSDRQFVAPTKLYGPGTEDPLPLIVAQVVPIDGVEVEEFDAPVLKVQYTQRLHRFNLQPLPEPRQAIATLDVSTIAPHSITEFWNDEIKQLSNRTWCPTPDDLVECTHELKELVLNQLRLPGKGSKEAKVQVRAFFYFLFFLFTFIVHFVFRCFVNVTIIWHRSVWAAL